eukprot:5307656-Pleurochrysis_carterae.AAC.1
MTSMSTSRGPGDLHKLSKRSKVLGARARHVLMHLPQGRTLCVTSMATMQHQLSLETAHALPKHVTRSVTGPMVAQQERGSPPLLLNRLEVTRVVGTRHADRVDTFHRA